MTRLRRAVTVPLVTALMVCLLLYGLPLLAFAVLADLVLRSSRPSRTIAIAIAYAAMELRALAKLLHGGQDGDQFMREFLETAYAAGRRILDVEVLLDTASVDPEEVPGDEPVIVLSRHCGPGDSVFVAWLLTVHYGLRLRIVLKALLRCEPALDLAASLVGGQALLLFPEGGNFSWTRWRNAIIQLRSSGRLREARRAWRQSHTLPPRIGGAAAALAGAPRANVLVLTHSGFCEDGRARLWWRLPIHRQLVVHVFLVPAVELPSPDQLSSWLQNTWSGVDAWVARHTDDVNPTPLNPSTSTGGKEFL